MIARRKRLGWAERVLLILLGLTLLFAGVVATGVLG